MATPSLRSDYKLIRHISKTYAPEIAMNWQDLPLIQISPDVLKTREGQSVLVSDAFEDLPFDDFIVECNGTGSAMQMFIEQWNIKTPVINLVHYWFRFIKGRVFQQNYKTTSPWFQPGKMKAVNKDFNRELQPDVFLEVWCFNEEDKDMITCVNPEITAIQVRSSQHFEYEHLLTETDQKMLDHVTRVMGREEAHNILKEYRNHLIMSAIILRYLKSTAEYMVEMRPEIARPRKGGRKDKKPWTYQYLPKIIMIDPNKVSEHRPAGHLRDGGSHASPRPHQRRGHYRKYKHERYTNMQGKIRFVKPAWVGPQEWILNGSVYRVLGLD